MATRSNYGDAQVVEHFRPMMWSGSRSTIFETNASLLDQFNVPGDAALATFIAIRKANLQDEAREDLDGNQA